jgi:long-chain acyl-CoA synthetase
MEKNKLREVTFFDTVKGLLYQSREKYGDKDAFIIKRTKGKEKTYIRKSYKEFLHDINSFGTGMYDLGLKGCRIAVAGRNSYEWAVTHFASILGGMVSVPLDKELGVNELEDSLVRSKAEAIVYDTKYEDKIRVIKDNAKSNVKHFIPTEGGELNFWSILENGKKIIDGGDTEFENCKLDPDAMSILLFTSGTTDKAKAVMLNQRGIACNVCDMQMVEDIRSTDTSIAFLPFHHIFGSTGLTVMLSCGVTMVFTDGLRYVRQNLKEYGVTLFVGVPLLIDSMKKAVEREVKKQGKQNLVKTMRKVSNVLRKFGIDVRRKLFKQLIDGLGGKMRLIISGGAPIDSETIRFYDDIGVDIVQGYGLTETSPVISAENEKFRRLGSVGIPMRNVEVKIDEKDADGIGQIKVKGPIVMLGYYENQEATDAVLSDGWFNTGDLGYLDKDGYLFITGRSKDMIVLKNGKKIFPEEIETLVNRIDGIMESFVYGYSEDGGISFDKIMCKAVYDPTVINDENAHDVIWEQIKEINKTLPMYKYIKGLTVTEEPLIKTTTNKIRRNEEIKTV